METKTAQKFYKPEGFKDLAVKETYLTEDGWYTWWTEADGGHTFTWGLDARSVAMPDALADDEEHALRWWNGEGPLAAYARMALPVALVIEQLGELYDLNCIDEEEMKTVRDMLGNLTDKLAKKYGTDHGREYWDELYAKRLMREYLNDTWEW